MGTQWTNLWRAWRCTWECAAMNSENTSVKKDVEWRASQTPSTCPGGDSLEKLQGAALFVNRKWDPVCVSVARDRMKMSGLGLPWWLRSGEFACRCGRHELDPWSERISRAAERLSPSTPATEPVPWAQEPQLLKPRAANTEARVPQSPCSSTGEATTVSSPQTATGEKLVWQWGPNTIRNK